MSSHPRPSLEATAAPRRAHPPLAAPSRWRWLLRRARTLCAQALALLVLLCATPGAAQLAQEAVELATGLDGCDDESCDDEGGACCTTCVCCAHPTTAPEASAAASGPPVVALQHAWLTDGEAAAGYRTPPFRPPAT